MLRQRRGESGAEGRRGGGSKPSKSETRRPVIIRGGVESQPQLVSSPSPPQRRRRRRTGGSSAAGLCFCFVFVFRVFVFFCGFAWRRTLTAPVLSSMPRQRKRDWKPLEQRCCTDVPWLVVFTLFCAGMVSLGFGREVRVKSAGQTRSDASAPIFLKTRRRQKVAIDRIYFA